MAETSDRLALPLLQAGQAQKEMYHNEALALLDLAVQACVESVGLDAPPLAPVPGQCWIVGAAPTGEWAGHAHALAGWTSGGWRYVSPLEGLAAWSRADGAIARFVGGSWVAGRLSGHQVVIDGVPVVGAQAAPVDTPAGGSTIDAEARTTISAILTVLRGHGLIAAS